MNKNEETLCWTCKYACGGCSWSDDLKPVKNWEAKKNDWSYRVINCPCYKEQDNPRYKLIPLNDLSKIMNMNKGVIQKLNDEQIFNICKHKGYKIDIDTQPNIRHFYILTNKEGGICNDF